LGQQRGEVARLSSCELQRRLGAFQRNERLGQPMPDRLEASDRSSELNTIQSVLACQRQHRLAGADKPPSERNPAGEKRHRVMLWRGLYRKLVDRSAGFVGALP